MKKLIVFLTIALLIFGMTACSPSNDGEDNLPSDQPTGQISEKDQPKVAPGDESDAPEDDPSEPSDLPETEEEEFTPTLSPFEEKLERAKGLFESFLEKEYMEELYFSVFSDDDQRILIHLFVDSESEFGQKLQAFEGDFDANGALNSENQAEWDAIIEALTGFCAQIKAEFPEFDYFQIITLKDGRVLLQIDKDLRITNHLTN